MENNSQNPPHEDLNPDNLEAQGANIESTNEDQESSIE
jgi:hypothetical protein